MNILINLTIQKITDICKKINMPTEAVTAICDVIDSYDFSEVSPLLSKLMDIKTAHDGFTEIEKLLEGNEKKGYIWLALSLAVALEDKKLYSEIGIPEKVFYDTMGIFSRDVNEHKESFGGYGFDRQFWTYRELSRVIFRIGELEYETTSYNDDDVLINGKTVIKKGDKILSIHIPSDGAITRQNCKASLSAAKKFFAEYFPDFHYEMFFCQSWIISPFLKEVLPETSNIVGFINLFEIYKTYPDDEGYKNWVFKNQNISIEEFPQNTSLQRNITAHLKKGGKIGAASGFIEKNKIE